MSDRYSVRPRGKIVTIYVPVVEYELAKRLKAEGKIRTLSSIWIEGYNAIYQSLTSEQKEALDGREQ